MEKIKRNERVIAMLKILSNSPNKSYTLNYFSDLFSAAKSTISEDIDIVREVLEKYSLGALETVTGAAGGVMYLARTDETDNYTFLTRICSKMQEASRILPGGFLYVTDILNDPAITARMGEILAGWYYDARADFVLTVETMGIPVALMTARSLGVPLIIARRDARMTDGSVVTINYISGSSHTMQRMSLPKRSVKEGQRALIVDDFLKGGGTAVGLRDLMKEFNAQVVGTAFVMEAATPRAKLIEDYRSLVVLEDVNEAGKTISVRPSKQIGKRD